MLKKKNNNKDNMVWGWQRGGHHPVWRTNFNKIHASRTVLTKFHESRNSTWTSIEALPLPAAIVKQMSHMPRKRLWLTVYQLWIVQKSICLLQLVRSLSSMRQRNNSNRASTNWSWQKVDRIEVKGIFFFVFWSFSFFLAGTRVIFRVLNGVFKGYSLSREVTPFHTHPREDFQHYVS